MFLRQEEKLAHDVYVYAYDKYGITIFNNISNSEQTHINNMTDLLAKYNIRTLLQEWRKVNLLMFSYKLYTIN
ncbi:MAG: DUF2202 domain-containing protein [Saprospiraceae bacterium]|nr:DUF2202 domain-containing protein [Saprospiraceae bacterium]